MRAHWLGLVGGVFCLLNGCGHAQPAKEPTSEADEPPADGAGNFDEPLDDETLTFDQEAADVVMKRGVRAAQSCLVTVAQGTVKGEEEVQVVFDGKKGSIVDVKLGPLFSTGSEQFQSCLKNSFVKQKIPPFTGTKTVPFTVKIEGKSN